MENRRKVLFLTQAAVIAALYVVLSLPMLSVSFGPIQFRLSEALTILPYFTPAAIPGLFVGCLLTNMIGSTVTDMIVGSLATLIAAVISYKLRGNKWLVPLAPVVVNGVMIGAMLHVIAFSGLSLIANMGLIALSEIVACYVIGLPLLLILEASGLFNRLTVVEPKNAQKVQWQKKNKKL